MKSSDVFTLKTKFVEKYELRKSTPGSSGYDVRADLEHDCVVYPNSIALIPTGIYCNLTKGMEVQVRPRSGLAFNHSVTVLNAPGTIDSDYKGEVGVLLINHGSMPYKVKPNERVAQLVISAVVLLDDDVDPGVVRGEGGFGSTGKE